MALHYEILLLVIALSYLIKIAFRSCQKLKKSNSEQTTQKWPKAKVYQSLNE